MNTFQPPRVRHLHQTELARDERPERFLVLAADRAHEIESPRLHLAGPISQRRKRNAELGVPACRVDRRGDGPRAVPIEVEPSERTRHHPRLARELDAATFSFVDDLCVILDSRRRGREDKAVLPIVVGIEHDAEVVALRDVAVADLLAANDSCRVTVVEPGAHVQRLPVGEDANLGAFGDWGAFVQLALDESGHWCGLEPRGIGEPAVDDGRLCDDAGGGYRRSLTGRQAPGEWEHHEQRDHETAH